MNLALSNLFCLFASFLLLFGTLVTADDCRSRGPPGSSRETIGLESSDGKIYTEYHPGVSGLDAYAAFTSAGFTLDNRGPLQGQTVYAIATISGEQHFWLDGGKSCTSKVVIKPSGVKVYIL
jgi:hypothetical protein